MSQIHGYKLLSAKSVFPRFPDALSLTFEAEPWRVRLRWLATHSGIPQNWVGPSPLDNVLIEKLALVRSNIA